MRRRLFLQGLGAAAASIPLSGCSFLREHDSLRFTATLKIATPYGTKTGSSVLEADMTGGLPGAGTMDSGSYFVRGQAPFVDLDLGKFLFLPLQAKGAAVGMKDLFTKWLAKQLPEAEGPNWRDTFPLARKRRPSGPVDFGIYRQPPMLVTFNNVRNPATITRVHHTLLSANFGPGYFLQSLNFDVSDQSQPLTEGFEDRFPKFFDIPGNGRFVQNNGSQRAEPHERLSGRDFVRR